MLPLAAGVRAFVGVGHFFKQLGRDEGFVVAISESVESRHTLRCVRPVEVTFGDHIVGNQHIGARHRNGVGQAIQVCSFGEESSRARRRRVDRSTGIAIERSRRMVRRPCGIGPGVSEASEFNVVLHGADSQHCCEPETIALHRPTTTEHNNRASRKRLRFIGRPPPNTTTEQAGNDCAS